MNNIYNSKPAKVLSIKNHTDSERSILLEYYAKNEPGKFVIVSLPGVGEVPISVSGFTPRGIELTIRNAGKVTSHIFRAKKGDYLHIRGPYGSMFPVDKFFAKHLLIIAGGSGMAAVKPVVEYFQKSDSCSLKELDILAGFRSPRHVLFRDELKIWQKWSKRCNIILTVDTAEDEEEAWKGSIGFVVEHVKEIKRLGEDTYCVIIGPPAMMVNTVNELFLFGVKPENVWMSFERHMKCGVGKCGHCRIRDKYVCVDGPVFNYKEAKDLLD